jgi:hypothetical protein
METIQTNQSVNLSTTKTVWTGRIISGLCTVFLLVDSLMKVFRASASVEGTASLGFSNSLVQPLGLIILAFTILYGIPRTAVFGAVMLTAHLGGAVAIFVQQFHGSLAFLFPLSFCVLLWAGLFLRDETLRTIVPLRKQSM